MILTNVGSTLAYIVKQDGDTDTVEAKATFAKNESTIRASEKIHDVIGKVLETSKESESAKSEMVIPWDSLITRNKIVDEISKEVQGCSTRNVEKE